MYCGNGKLKITVLPLNEDKLFHSTILFDRFCPLFRNGNTGTQKVQTVQIKVKGIRQKHTINQIVVPEIETKKSISDKAVSVSAYGYMYVQMYFIRYSASSYRFS